MADYPKDELPLGHRFDLTGFDGLLWLEQGTVELHWHRTDADGIPTAPTHVLTATAPAVLPGWPNDTGGQWILHSLGAACWRVDGLYLKPVAAHWLDSLPPLLDCWLGLLGQRLAQDFRFRGADYTALQPGQTRTAPTAERLLISRGIAWTRVLQGQAIYTDLLPIASTSNADNSVASAWLPLSNAVWMSVEAHSVVECQDTRWLLEHEQGWHHVQQFQRAYAECLNKALSIRQRTQTERLLRRQQQSHRAMNQALTEIALLQGEQEQATATEDLNNPLLACALAVLKHQGWEGKLDALNLRRRGNETPWSAAEIARIAHCRCRQVALRGAWWQQDLGPILALVGEEATPIALLPDRPGHYRRYDPQTQEFSPVDEALLDQIQPLAWRFYLPLPDRVTQVGRLLWQAVKQHPRDWSTAALATALASLIALALPVLTGLAVNHVIPSQRLNMLWQIGFALALTSVSAALLKWVSDVALLRIEGQVAAQLQAGVIDRLLRLPSRFFNAYSSADLAQRTLAIENLRKAVTGVVLSAVMASISLVPQLILMFWYSPGVASVGLGVMLLYLAVAAWAGYRQLRAIYEGEAITANITNVTLQLIQGVTKLRLAGAEQRAFAHWAHLFADMRLRSLRSQRIAHRFALFQGAFDFVSLGMAFALVALLSQTQLNTGEFLAFLSTYGLSLRATQQMGGALMQVLNVKPLVERIEPLLGAPVEVDERKLNPGTLSGYVEVMNLAFRYGPGQPRVLNGLSLSVRPGQFVALVGASGCGKSTLLKLLLGFEQPEVGGVFLDGKDLRTLDLQAVRRQIGVVLQSGKIMPGSLFDNIRGATNITLDEAWEAARQAGLEADIRAMPMQMHTVLTEGTASLSGGQAQRLLIARALAGKPRLLIFDEATSALDNKTQAQVTQSLSSLAVTRIAIAHRLSTVMDADCIHVIDNGKVIESGTYSQLMALEGHFHRLVTRQVI